MLFYAMANKTDPWQKAGINIDLTDFAGTGGGGTSDFIASLVQRHDRALSKVAKRYQYGSKIRKNFVILKKSSKINNNFQ